jgi:hypothetical protein
MSETQPLTTCCMFFAVVMILAGFALVALGLLPIIPAFEWATFLSNPFLIFIIFGAVLVIVGMLTLVLMLKSR